jgi:hypothetical protein
MRETLVMVVDCIPVSQCNRWKELGADVPVPYSTQTPIITIPVILTL